MADLMVEPVIGAVVGALLTGLGTFLVRNFRPTLVYRITTFSIDLPLSGDQAADVWPIEDRIELSSVQIFNKNFFKSRACVLHVDSCRNIKSSRIQKAGTLSKETISFEIQNDIGIVSLPSIPANSEVRIITYSKGRSIGEYTSITSTTADVKVKSYFEYELPFKAARFFGLIIVFMVSVYVLASAAEQWRLFASESPQEAEKTPERKAGQGRS